MRKLNTSDVFAAARLIKKVDIKEKLKDLYLTAKNKKIEIMEAAEADKENSGKKELDNLTESIGIDMFYMILEECTEEALENAVYEFLARPFEVSPKEVAEMELDKLMEHLKTLAKENNILAFFKQAGQLKL